MKLINNNVMFLSHLTHYNVLIVEPGGRERPRTQGDEGQSCHVDQRKREVRKGTLLSFSSSTVICASITGVVFSYCFFVVLRIWFGFNISL